MGRYIPPDQADQQFNKKHPLGSRARHLQTKGALIVRFEMPFAIWCTTCPEKSNTTLIGQGVRFNAEKKKVGNYYSTPIYSFRMRHPPCGGWIEIRTDPANTAYVVTEGARKRETGEEEGVGIAGEIRVGLGGDAEAKAKEDAFERLEGKVEDKRQFDSATARINEIQKRQDRDWEDPYELSRRLRKTFRAERKKLEGIDAANEALKDRMSLGIDLLAETEEDRIRAGMIDFGADQRNGFTNDSTELLTSRTKPMFDANLPEQVSKTKQPKRVHKHDTRRSKKLKSEAAVEERKALLSSELRGNTRAALDPFLNDDKKAWQPEILKRRKPRLSTHNTSYDNDKDEASGMSSATADTESGNLRSKAPSSRGDSGIIQQDSKIALVNYGSDSD